MRLRVLATATFIACAGLAVPAAVSAQQLPPQEPGVTMRVYDLQEERSQLCTLKPGQTPNVDRLMPVIDWASTSDFGVTDFFQTEVTANLRVTAAGTYRFRLTSDDGSRLSINGATVISYDGIHPAQPADGSIGLTAGYHALRVDHFDARFDQVLRVEWQPPGASGFTVVPNSVLSTDAGVVRVTAPGRKECGAGRDTPGDGLPLAGVHPGYSLTNLRPSGFNPQVSAMAWLPDGRLAISTWGGSEAQQGEVHLLSGVTGQTDPSRVRTQRIAQGLREPMGLAYVDGKLYVSDKNGLIELNDTNGDWVTDQYRTIARWPFSGNFHEFAFGLLYRDGLFYVNLSVPIDRNGASTEPQSVADRGLTITVNKSTGQVGRVAGGLRTPNGIGFGPDGDVFVTDNQGDWLPSSKLVHVKQDRFFNHYNVPAGPFDNRAVTAPALWLPQNEIANSPSNPVMLPNGPFAGQLIFGDVTYGGIQRGFLEKVNGEYQGAVFRMTQGLEAGVNRISLGPDGAIYAGGIGSGGNWGQPGKLSYGLQKLTPTGASAFDIRTMRAVPGGFELQYTQPLSTETATNLTAKYEIQQWRYAPTTEYGGAKLDQSTLMASSAQLSSDRTTVRLSIPGLRAGHVVHLRSPRPFAAQSGQALWSTEAWYTLNSLAGTAGPVDYEAETAGLSGGAVIDNEHPGYSGTGFVAGYVNRGAATAFSVTAQAAGQHDLTLRYANGPYPFTGAKTVSVYVNGQRVRQARLSTTRDWATWSTHTETVPLQAGVNTVTIRRDDGDDGSINLDRLTVRPVSRITLFDGSNLNAWRTGGGGQATWPIANGSMESFGGDIRTRAEFGDHRLHVEWWQPNYPSNVTGQTRGNSGVYLQERYEIQVLDSYQLPAATNGAGAVYEKHAPSTNAATAPGTWQTYDITFRAARYDSSGVKIANARVSVVWNGVLVHNDVQIDGTTVGGFAEGAGFGAIRLQDHGDAGENPRFRNIWIEPMG